MHRTVQGDLLKFNKPRSPSFSALPLSKFIPQNVPDSHLLSSEAPSASYLQMADLTNGTMEDTLPRSRGKNGLCLHALCCINDDNTLLKLASLVVSSNTVGIWKNLAGEPSTGRM